jgi:FAD/FMN-containing dehydrogenase
VDVLRRELAATVGEGHVLADPELRASYETDWTGRFHGSASLVVRPADTEEAAAVVAACGRARAAVVPQGGNTGLVGGGVPRGGEVVLTLERLDAIESVDAAAAQIAAGAGVTLAALQEALRGSGLAFGVDHAARTGATLGGMVATNAGGARAIRYGSMRAQVAGLEAVLADGRVLTRMSGLAKDNAGYDLPAVITGSEGTLAVVTRVLLKLVPELTARVAALFAVGGSGAALALLTRLRGRVASLEAAELFFADGLDLVRAHRRLAAPFPEAHPAYLLVECAGGRDPTEELAAAAADAPEPRAVAVADDTEGRAALWAYRDGHTEAINAAGTPHKLDVAVPLAALPGFERRVRERIAARTIVFGHLGDGNLHVNVLGVDPDDETVDAAVLELVADAGGSVGAEHGIGVAKRRWLGFTRSHAEIDAMSALKRALDPRGTLNPGVLLPD